MIWTASATRLLHHGNEAHGVKQWTESSETTCQSEPFPTWFFLTSSLQEQRTSNSISENFYPKYKLPLPLTTMLSVFIPSNNKTIQKQTWLFISLSCTLLDLKYKINLKDRRKNGICLLSRAPLNWALAGYPKNLDLCVLGTHSVSCMFLLCFIKPEPGFKALVRGFVAVFTGRFAVTLAFKKEVSPVNPAPGFFLAPFPFSHGEVTLFTLSFIQTDLII